MKTVLSNIFNGNDVYAYCPNCGESVKITDTEICVNTSGINAEIEAKLSISTKNLAFTCGCGERMLIVDDSMLNILKILKDKGYEVKSANCGGNISGIHGNGIFCYEQPYIKFYKHCESTSKMVENFYANKMYSDLCANNGNKDGYRFLHIGKYKLELLHDCTSKLYFDQYVSDAVRDIWYDELLDFVTYHLPSCNESEFYRKLQVNVNQNYGCVGNASEFDGDCMENDDNPNLLIKIYHEPEGVNPIEQVAKCVENARHECQDVRRRKYRRRRSDSEPKA